MANSFHILAKIQEIFEENSLIHKRQHRDNINMVYLAIFIGPRNSNFVGRFDTSLIRFKNRKFNLLTDWGGYKGNISNPIGQYVMQIVHFLLPGPVWAYKVTA